MSGQPWTFKGVQSPLTVPEAPCALGTVTNFAEQVGMMLPLLTVGQCEALIASINKVLPHHTSANFYVLTGAKWVVRGMSRSDDEEEVT